MNIRAAFGAAAAAGVVLSSVATGIVLVGSASGRAAERAEAHATAARFFRTSKLSRSPPTSPCLEPKEGATPRSGLRTDRAAAATVVAPGNAALPVPKTRAGSARQAACPHVPYPAIISRRLPSAMGRMAYLSHRQGLGVGPEQERL